MILELALILFLIYVLYEQHVMHQAPDTLANAEPVVPNVPIPQPRIVVIQTPIVTPKQVTSQKATLDVTPAWFESVKPVDPRKIRFPATYDRNSAVDYYTYSCLSSYRSMTKKTNSIDFVTEPFTSSVDNMETVVVILNEIARRLGARLTFTHTDFQYNDSDYRTACGVTNLGSIHSLLSSEANYLTAKFNLQLNLDYDQITASIESLRNFVLIVINHLSTVSWCDKDFIRVFSISRDASILLEFGITTPKLDQTKEVADRLKKQLYQIASQRTPGHGIFQYLCPKYYDYKLEPALAFLQLQKSDFEPRFNRDYPHAKQERRGGYPYHFPQGWYRHALSVVDKYPGDQTWLCMNNSPGEWAVAYHGTKSGSVRGITDQGLLHHLVVADWRKNEARQQNPSIPDVNGLYVATHCQDGASNYTELFEVKESSGMTKKYRVVFQCRVQPGKFTQHQMGVKTGMVWRVFDEKAIRPYGLLLKSS